MIKKTLSEQLKLERQKLFKYQIAKSKSIKVYDTVFDNSDALYSIAYKHRNNYRGNIKIDINNVISVVCKKYKLNKSDVIGTCRKSDIIHARHIAIFILYQFLPVSLKHIGRIMSNRDHSTIRHAVFKVADIVKIYPYIRKDLQTILKHLQFIKD